LCFGYIPADPLTYEGHISKTTAVINLKGSVDVMVSPLMLEALQRFVFRNSKTIKFLYFVMLHLATVCNMLISLSLNMLNSIFDDTEQ